MQLPMQAGWFCLRIFDIFDIPWRQWDKISNRKTMASSLLKPHATAPFLFESRRLFPMAMGQNNEPPKTQS